MVNMADNGIIYVIGAEGSQLVKIGMSRVSAQYRLEQMQNFSPMSLYIIAQTRVESQICRVEHVLHGLLYGNRHRGEWFAMELDQGQLDLLVAEAQDILFQKALYEEQHPMVLTPEQVKRRVSKAAYRSQLEKSLVRRRRPSEESPPPVPAPSLVGNIPEPLDWLSLANHLRVQRKMISMTRSELARRSGVKESTIGKIERGQYRNVGIETVMLLAVVLGVTIEYTWKTHV